MTKLKTIRARSGLSQSQLADKAAVSVRMLQAYEQGRKSINAARADTVCRIAKVLDVDVAELLENEDC